MLLVRTNSNGSIDVVGSMQAGFSSGEDVEVRNGAVFVNGVKQDWTLFPNMVLATPTETPTPTPKAPEFYSGLAPTLEQFPVVDKADISAIVAALRAGPTLLDANAGPILVGEIMSRPDGYKYLTMYCNQDGIVNCAPAASIQFTDSINGAERNPHVIIWEVMTPNGRGYIVGYAYDPIEMYFQNQYNTLRKNPRGPQTFNFVVGYSSDWQNQKPYEYSQTQQPGFLDAMRTFSEKDIITPEFEALIMLTTGL